MGGGGEEGGRDRIGGATRKQGQKENKGSGKKKIEKKERDGQSESSIVLTEEMFPTVECVHGNNSPTEKEM